MEEHGKCSKEREWGEVTTALQFFQEAEKRREAREIRTEERDLRMIQTMETISGQGEVIKHLQETSGRHETALDEAFRRIRRVENPSIIVRLSRTKLGRIALGTLVVMAIIGFVKNPEALGKVVKAFIQ